MKGFVKRITAGIFAAAMLMSVFGTLGAGAAEAVVTINPIDRVWTWQDGTDGTYPREASLKLDYSDNKTAVEGAVSLTALYEDYECKRLIGVSSGMIGTDGTVTYAMNVPVKPEQVKCFLWSDTNNTIKPKANVYNMLFTRFISPKAFSISNSFESGAFQIFQYSGKYNATIADNGANGSSKCAFIDRGDTPTENGALRTKIYTSDIKGGSDLKISAYMKRAETVTEDVEFYISVLAPGNTFPAEASTPIQVTDNDWHKVEYTVAAATVEKGTGGIIVQLSARKGSADNYSYDVDYYADDFKATRDGTAIRCEYDDVVFRGLNWDFEDADRRWAMESYDKNSNARKELHFLYNTGTWCQILEKQILKAENVTDVESFNPKAAGVEGAYTEGDTVTDVNALPSDSTRVLAVEADATVQTGDTTKTKSKSSHISARVRLSQFDIQPGKTYNVSFYARGNTKQRALYAKLIKQDLNNPMPGQYGKGANGTAVDNANAGGILCKTDASVNRIGAMEQGWKKYSFEITPTTDNFSEGAADLCILMTYDCGETNSWDWKDIYLGEKLYLDDIEITEVKPAAGEVTALVNDGTYTKRATFENDTMTMFSPQARASVALTNADSHTGDYCAEYTERSRNNNRNWNSLGASIKGAAPSSKVTVSSFLKKAEPGQPKRCIG